jgi:hypothetical protein
MPEPLTVPVPIRELPEEPGRAVPEPESQIAELKAQVAKLREQVHDLAKPSDRLPVGPDRGTAAELRWLGAGRGTRTRDQGRRVMTRPA